MNKQEFEQFMNDYFTTLDKNLAVREAAKANCTHRNQVQLAAWSYAWRCTDCGNFLDRAALQEGEGR